MLTDQEIKGIRERCKKATPGPWIKKETEWYGEPRTLILDKEDAILAMMNNKGNLDFDFIAHAREDIPALLDMVGELKNTIERERQSRDYIEDLEAKLEKIESKVIIACKDCKNPPVNDDYSCKWFGECGKHQ